MEVGRNTPVAVIGGELPFGVIRSDDQIKERA